MNTPFRKSNHASVLARDLTAARDYYETVMELELLDSTSSLEESSLCIVELKAAHNVIPKAKPSPTLSITAPRIIPKTTPFEAPNAILFSSNDFFKFNSLK